MGTWKVSHLCTSIRCQSHLAKKLCQKESSQRHLHQHAVEHGQTKHLAEKFEMLQSIGISGNIFRQIKKILTMRYSGLIEAAKALG